MKKSLTILFFFAAISAAIAQQVTVVNNAVQPIYKGVENPITVQVNHYKPSELTIVVSVGSITKTNDSGSYSWRICDTQEKYGILKVYCGKQLVMSKKFRLRQIPNPEVTIGHWSCRGGGPKIQTVRGIRTELNDFVLEGVEANVVSFTVTIRKYNYMGVKDTLILMDNEGAMFIPPVKKLLESLVPGEVVIFDNIKVKVGCESRLRKVREIVFRSY